MRLNQDGAEMVLLLQAVKPTGHTDATASERRTLLEASQSCLTEPAAEITSSKMPPLP